MKLYIKNMVCPRCIMAVRAELEKLGLYFSSIELGEIVLTKNLTIDQKEQLNLNLNLIGFQLLEDAKLVTVQKIKNLILDLVQNQSNDLKVNLSVYLVSNLRQDYNTLSSLFSEIEDKTIEHFFIQQKIEKVKELLTYNELNLNEIADQMNYSSVAYLSNQFKKVTGITPSEFKLSKNVKRLQINEV
ncbi:AraC family transcriptional regulator [Lacihabitans sp. CCS-44]|uniref:helix-turn-helix domain-containing protein n=1 Tax=Lacihabitans sp. CCS-44 TaxID=2487331 RepID=UPI0020CF2720|nr:AraC family transcriptional regulator [Lacihabitans sp. CCS-44]MCP9755942.1 AraC family transcriptional regulator [Lacihabitans sp. CCS-44]